jgi:hypothetical protein
LGAVLVARLDFRAGLLRQVRAIVRSGELGTLTYCRVSGKPGRRALPFILDGAAPGVISFDDRGCGLKLCGTDATLAVTANDCRIHPSRRAAGLEK